MTNLIIAGSRTFQNYDLLELEVKRFIYENKIILPVSIVSGKAQGADSLGEKFAKKYNFPIIEMSANWNEYGKVAGPIRNEEMAKISDACIVFIEHQSKGSLNMIENAKKYNLILKVIEI